MPLPSSAMHVQLQLIAWDVDDVEKKVNWRTWIKIELGDCSHPPVQLGNWATGQPPPPRLWVISFNSVSSKGTSRICEYCKIGEKYWKV